MNLPSHLFIIESPRARCQDELRRERVLFYGIAITLLVLFGILVFGFSKDYRIVTTGQKQYDILVEVTPEEASKYLKTLDVLQVPVLSICDVRLPNGDMVCAFIQRKEAERIAKSDTAQTVITHWDVRDIRQPLIYEDLNLMVVYGEFGYNEFNRVVSEATAQKEPFCIIRQGGYLSDGRPVEYRLPTSTASGYLRRMHCIGASKILIPFFWNLDPKNPIGINLTTIY